MPPKLFSLSPPAGSKRVVHSLTSLVSAMEGVCTRARRQAVLAVPSVNEALPLHLLLVCLLRLPMQQRVAAEAVCRLWRELLSSPSLWRFLDMSPSALGTAATHVQLRAMLPRCLRSGGFRGLDASGAHGLTPPMLLEAARRSCATPGALPFTITAPSVFWSAVEVCVSQE